MRTSTGARRQLLYERERVLCVLPQPLCWGETELRTYMQGSERDTTLSPWTLSASLSHVHPRHATCTMERQSYVRTYVRIAVKETPLCRRVPLGLSLPRPLLECPRYAEDYLVVLPELAGHLLRLMCPRQF